MHFGVFFLTDKTCSGVHQVPDPVLWISGSFKNDLIKNTGTLTKNFAQKTMQLKTDGQTTKDQNSFFRLNFLKNLYTNRCKLKN